MTPYIGFGNDTLKRLPSVKPGDSIDCPTCKGKHKLEAASDGSTLLLFYKCGNQLYLGAIDGKCTIGVKADVSGSMSASTEPGNLRVE
jgi:hypothetical protein